MKRLIGLLCALLLFGACNDARSGSSSTGEIPVLNETEDVDRPDPGNTASTDKPDDDKKERADQGGKGGKGDGDGDGSASGSNQNQDGGGSDGDGGGGNDLFDEGEGEDDNSSALHPAAGEYLYSQKGYERFCQAARCEQQALPNQQSIGVAVKSRTQDKAVVVSDIEASDNRLVRTTATYTRQSSLITHVYARFAYEGFTFENEYTPEPPVESLRFPLSEGSSWSGRWRDSTSGTYQVSVLGRESVSVSGRAVQAFKLSTVTEFTGEFEGTSKALIWLDPATKSVVKTTGKVDLRSAFGRYITEFDNQLRSGPGYR